MVLGNLTANRIKSTDEWNDLNTPVEQSIPAESAEPKKPVVQNSDVPAATETKKSDDSDVPK